MLYSIQHAVGAVLVSLLALAVALAIGCGENGPTDSGRSDPDLADSLVKVAGDSLGKMMDEVINETLDDPDSTFRPGAIDFNGVLSLYERALAANPNNNDARFGAAFAGLMVFLADPGLNNLYERFKDLIDTGGGFPTSQLPEVTLGREIAVPGMPLSSGSFTKLLIDITRLDPLLAKAAVTDPTISEIQLLLETSLLPKITKAQGRILAIIGSPDYEFTITPEMQGNPGASPIVLDRADFRVILASLHALEAAIHIFVARDLDLPSYTIAGVEEALRQGSSFLSLKDNNVGTNHMSAAKVDILAAEIQLEHAVSDLLAELGEDQTNDLIKVYPGDQEDLIMIRDSLSFYRSYFNGPKELQVIWRTGESWWYDPYTGLWYWIATYDTFRVTVDVAKFFDNPIENPKDLLPGYTLTLDSNTTAYKEFAALHFSRQAYWDSLLSIYGVSYPNDTAQSLQQYGFWGHLPDEDNDDFYLMLDGRYSQSVFGWDDLQYWGGSALYVWNYMSYNRYEYEHLYYSRDDWIACYEWTDASYAAWTWRNPTFNGLFPEMTSGRIKNEILEEVDETNWKRSDCGSIDFDLANGVVGPIGP